jgi:hypothetical protein
MLHERGDHYIAPVDAREIIKSSYTHDVMHGFKSTSAMAHVHQYSLVIDPGPYPLNYKQKHHNTSRISKSSTFKTLSSS